MNKDLEATLKDASNFIKKEFSIEIQKSKLKIYSQNEWEEFCKINNFQVLSSGLYVPASYSAYVNSNSPVLLTDVFHEYYGHGLFSEHSRIGQELIKTIKNNGNERDFLISEIDQKKQPWGFFNTNISNYEGFAVWMENLLCKETNNEKTWNKREQLIPSAYKEAFEHIQDAEQNFSRFGIMSQLGFPKFYDGEKVLKTIKKMYNSKFEDIDLVILYGSQKPYSDIDLCVISKNESFQYFNEWLDIAQLSREEFLNRLNNLDIAITDAMFTGTIIYGDKKFFEQKKQEVINMPITQDKIDYNTRKSKEQDELLKIHKENPRNKELCLSYKKSFARNAEQLQKGNKALTLKKLEEIYGSEFRNPRNI